jgi:hypothetical protein
MKCENLVQRKHKVGEEPKLCKKKARKEVNAFGMPAKVCKECSKAIKSATVEIQIGAIRVINL